MNLFFFYSAGENLNDKSDKHSLPINGLPHDMNEGSEFLDDAIRMKDLPLYFSEEKIDAGHTWNLL
jgi:hypothetical protein